MSERNARSRKVAPAHIQHVKRKYELYGCSTQKEFAHDIGISVSTLANFLAGKPINKADFGEICTRLGLDWQEISELTADSPTRESSPFITGNPITHPRYFFGRESELKRIFSLLNRHPLQNVAIIGNKRIGKTSLLHYLQTITRTSATELRAGQKNDWLRQPNQYRWVFVDFQNVQLQNEGGLLHHILRSLGVPVPEPFDLAAFMDILSSYLQQPTVIIFDEIGVGLQRCPELDERFWECLRSLATNYAQGNLAYILAAPILPSDLAKQYGYSSPFFNIFGDTRYLAALTDTEARDLIASSPVNFAPADVEWILAKSQRLPLLLQILCRERLASLELGEDDDWQAAALQQIEPFLTDS
jgi:transcriptional regulator with XRE-family HTH domain